MRVCARAYESVCAGVSGCPHFFSAQTGQRAVFSKCIGVALAYGV